MADVAGDSGKIVLKRGRGDEEIQVATPEPHRQSPQRMAISVVIGSVLVAYSRSVSSSQSDSRWNAARSLARFVSIPAATSPKVSTLTSMDVFLVPPSHSTTFG